MIRRTALLVVGLCVGVWGAGALWFDGPAFRPLAGGLAAAFLLVSLAPAFRPTARWLATATALWVVTLTWWNTIPPSNDRDWLPDVARPAEVEFHDGRVTIRNVRDFTYRSETDYTPRWETRTYDLGAVRGLDLFLSYWGSPLIAHTIMSWEFETGPPLAISIETRKERGETYSAVRGFYRQFELYYVVADERDVVALRTNHRGEQVYLYRLGVPPDVASALLRSYLEEVHHLAAHPRWYNAATHNCTTTIRLHVLQIGVPDPWDWRFLVNGYVDELLYERGTIATDRPFQALRTASDVTARARATGDGAEFSSRIREGLPPRPAASRLRRASRGHVGAA